MVIACSMEAGVSSRTGAMKDVFYDSVGMGKDVRLDRKGIVGSALVK
jgi:hypothetical protein